MELSGAGPHRPLRLAVATATVDIPGNLFLAPVAGYSDAAFRSICFEQGADLCYTEMVSAEALRRGHAKTRELLARADNETRYAIQLFGSDPSALGEAAALLIPYKPLIVDLNCGCPVPKIVKAGAGSALMKNPALIRDLMAAMARALAPAGIAVTAKIRLGWDEMSVNYREAAAAALEGGAAALTLHARTRAQGYSGEADWEAIALLAREMPVPVFGSGDVFSAEDAARLLRHSGTAGIMFARGALGNPFIFSETAALLAGLQPERISMARRADVARRHLGLAVKFLGERVACVEFRKQFCAYTKGLPGGAQLREKAVRSATMRDFDLLFEQWAALD